NAMGHPISRPLRAPRNIAQADARPRLLEQGDDPVLRSSVKRLASIGPVGPDLALESNVPGVDRGSGVMDRHPVGSAVSAGPQVGVLPAAIRQKARMEVERAESRDPEQILREDVRPPAQQY